MVVVSFAAICRLLLSSGRISETVFGNEFLVFDVCDCFALLGIVSYFYCHRLGFSRENCQNFCQVLVFGLFFLSFIAAVVCVVLFFSSSLFLFC